MKIDFPFMVKTGLENRFLLKTLSGKMSVIGCQKHYFGYIYFFWLFHMYSYTKNKNNPKNSLLTMCDTCETDLELWTWISHYYMFPKLLIFAQFCFAQFSTDFDAVCGILFRIRIRRAPPWRFLRFWPSSCQICIFV